MDCVDSQECNPDHPVRKTEHLFYFAPGWAKLGYFFTELTGDLKVNAYLKKPRLGCEPLYRLTSLLSTHTDDSFDGRVRNESNTHQALLIDFSLKR